MVNVVCSNSVTITDSLLFDEVHEKDNTFLVLGGIKSTGGKVLPRFFNFLTAAGK